MTTSQPSANILNGGFAFALILVPTYAFSPDALASSQAPPYRLVWVDDLPDAYSATQVKLFPNGSGNGDLPELLRFRMDEMGSIVGTSIAEVGGTPHSRATVWVLSSGGGAGSPSRMRLVFPSSSVGAGSDLDSVATSVATAAGVLRIGGASGQPGALAPAVWSVSMSTASPPSLTAPSLVWRANALGMVQAVGKGPSPMVGGAVSVPATCERRLPFMHDTAGPASPIGQIDDPCGWADPANQAGPMEMQGSTYAVVSSGASSVGFGWRVCLPCSLIAQPYCGMLSGNVQYEQFARWVPGAAAGSWQFTPPGYVTTDSRAIAAVPGAAAGWSRSRGTGSNNVGSFPCSASHGTVLAFGNGFQAFMDVHYALNDFEITDVTRTNSRVADISMAPIGWCSDSEPNSCATWMLVGARFAGGDASPLEFGGSSRGVVWQGNAGGNWCGKRAEALCVNVPTGDDARLLLEVRAVHAIGLGGTAVAIGYLDIDQGEQVPNWGTRGPKLILMTHPADYNGDLHVDGADLGLFLSHWGASDPQYDVNGDGTIDGSDLGLILGAWAVDASFVSIPKWDCDRGWHTLPVIAAGTLAAQVLGFEDLDELGDFAAAQDPATAYVLAFEAAIITQSINN